MKILITGASGFVGKALSLAAQANGHRVVRAVRNQDKDTSSPTYQLELSESDNGDRWQTALQGVDVVVHLAGVAHTDHAASPDAEAFYHRNNVLASENVINEANRAGVQRMVYLSSVKAVAERSMVDRDGSVVPLTDIQTPQPEDIYGKSKYLAECRLTRLAEEFGMQLVIIRSPLVYGVGQKGNLAKLYRLVRGGAPLPFAGIKNSRSMISVNNLCSAIIAVAQSKPGPNGTYFVSDVEISTSELIRAIGVSINKPARQFQLPVSVLDLAFRLLGKRSLLEKLLGSLTVDSNNFKTRFNWLPTEEFAAVLADIGSHKES